MITKKERKRLKRVLGSHYTNVVSKQLEADGILDKKGVPYKANMIRVVFSGSRSNHKIEVAIFKAYEKRLTEIKNQKKIRENILTKKPIVVATDF